MGEAISDYAKRILPSTDLDRLLEALQQKGYTLVGPTVRENAIVLEEIEGAEDLPVGWTETQEAGSYKLSRNGSEEYFDFASGPHSFKKYLFPPRLKLWQAKRHRAGFKVEQEYDQAPSYAFIGVRSCDLCAIEIQDKVFMGDSYVDPVYKERREKAFILAVNCTKPGNLCFCSSMDTGPKAKSGYDLAVTEQLKESEHVFLIQAGSEKGHELLEALELADADEGAVEFENKQLEDAATSMGRFLDTHKLPSVLKNNFEHPRWEQIADRCLSCANCTLVCPTCFCHTVEDTTDLTGDVAERWRQWDSCFTGDFTYFAGGSARASTKSRYRQWLTHKLSTWTDQFGTFGCVGCGRCIAWCPVGIDLTEEAAAIRATDLVSD